MNKFGFAKVAVCSPVVSVGNPKENRNQIEEMLSSCKDDDVIVFPELSITGYTCGDLFRQRTLLEAAEREIGILAEATKTHNNLVFIGAPVTVDGSLYNCAIAICGGNILGIVPKQHIPNYNEFYEKRWFKGAATGLPNTISYANHQNVPFGIDLIFNYTEKLKVFAEICEDLFMPIPPSSVAAMHGANLLVNLSASPESVAKYEYRMELIRNQSGRCIAAYAYASAGPSESTTDLVFSGHCIICENGNTLTETTHVGDGRLHFGKRRTSTEIDVDRIDIERRLQETFTEGASLVDRKYRNIVCPSWKIDNVNELIGRKVAETPFVPSDPAKLAERCASVFDIQCAALAKRLKTLNFPDIHIGVSGGLDSTHALLVAHKTLQALGQPLNKIKAITMPGFGTTSQTRNIALELMKELGVSIEEIDIRPLCMQMFKDLQHKPFGILLYGGKSVYELTEDLKKIPDEKRHDLVFENVQARARTMFLMSRGFVIGTGDMSELALGWCTYNGDHMSMYGLNCGVPKTLIKFMVRYVADNHYPAGNLRDRLYEVSELTISPQLLPANSEGKDQSTEDSIGPYVLHDFYLLNLIRYGFTPEKTLWLTEQCKLKDSYSFNKRYETMVLFLKRFFSQQFKRTCVPDGPKVGTLSLSPRGDWRMPTDASVEEWIESIAYLKDKKS